MKILFNCNLPFMLAHGGLQIQIEQTKAALENAGVTVEHLRWWDESQSGDVLHYFGRIPLSHLDLAQKKGIKVVMGELLTAQGSRTWWRLKLQGAAIDAMRYVLPSYFISPFNWESYRRADGCVALTAWEGRLMNEVFGASPEKVFVVPNGVETIFFDSKEIERGPWLVCTATITERKRVLELAQAALLAEAPLWVIGKAYADSDPYAQKFMALAKQNPKLIRYEGAVSDRTEMAQIYRAARGFVLLSTMESLSLSALESAACRCPLLLSDLPWARGTFGDRASYCPITSARATALVLRKFYDACPTLLIPPSPKTWAEIGEQLRNIYETLLKTSR